MDRVFLFINTKFLKQVRFGLVLTEILQQKVEPTGEGRFDFSKISIESRLKRLETKLNRIGFELFPLIFEFYSPLEHTMQARQQKVLPNMQQ